MTTKTRKLAALALFLAPALALSTGCEQQGPAEKAGESIDKGVRDVKDAVVPPGPAEKAGRAVDDATK